METIVKILLIILLAFSFVEIYFLIRLAEFAGVLPVILLLAASAWAGWQLLKSEYRTFLKRAFMPANLGTLPARNLVAGILLIVPGILSDLAAIVVLLWPKRTRTTEDGIIEGKFQRMD